jgi:bifunctional non-homologous end joining protein LigD
MLATLVGEAPAGVFRAEVKYDGFRALCALSNRRVAMWTRNGLDLTARFPHVAGALAAITVGDAVIDGEIGVLDAQGVSRFELMQQGREGAVLFAFDLLRLDGEDLRQKPLEARLDLLRSVLANAPAELRLAEEMPGSPDEALARARERGLEGVVLKERGSAYQGGRSRAWLKLKAQAAQELAIAGWTPGKGAQSGSLGALLLAVADGRGGFEFAGKVGTGFTSKERAELKKRLAEDEMDKAPAGDAPRLRDAHWVKPRLVAQVRFTEWTSDGKLRHPAFQGLREDKKPEECVREKPTAGAGALAKNLPKQHSTIRLSNPDRLLYPKDRISKQEVAGYYAAIAPALLPAVRDRPLALVHWNRGIEGDRWFQQGVRPEPWMTLAETPARTKAGKVKHLIAADERALQWLAQNSVLELHAWHSRAQSLTQPDWVVFDLDPAEGKGIEQAIEVAQVLRGMFERLGLPSVPKTSGKRGLHIHVPLAPGHTFDDAQSFALQVGETVVKQMKNVTLERSKARRDGRLYFDCLQNGYGKTVVAPYSPRGVPGAPVSAPLRWEEIDGALDPSRFNLRTMPQRLAEVGDLFAPALQQGVRLPRYGR